MKTIFWNVDTQYDFMRKDGALYVPDAEKIEKKLEKLTGYARMNRIQVVNTCDQHDEDSEEISEHPDFVNTFPAHCIRNTIGAKFIPATDPKNGYVIDWKDKTFDKNKLQDERNIIIYKDKFDVFEGNPHTKDILEAIKPGKVIVYGVATNFCVDYAVMGLVNQNLDVYVPVDAIKELSVDEPELTLDATLAKWERNGVKLTAMNEVI